MRQYFDYPKHIFKPLDMINYIFILKKLLNLTYKFYKLHILTRTCICWIFSKLLTQKCILLSNIREGLDGGGGGSGIHYSLKI